MSRKQSEFTMFGLTYRTRQFDASSGLEVMETIRDIHPCAMLAHTEILVDDKWLSLAIGRHIDEYVKDIIDIIPPARVLFALTGLVNEFSFGFLTEWKGIKIPQRFLAGFKSVSSGNAQPLIAQLVQDGVADLRSLQEYYSLEDAFKMFDIIMAKGVNEALSSEAASKQK